MPHEFAQVNIARLAAPIDSMQLRGFVRSLDRVNSAADRADGFVWRLQDESGDATSLEGFEWDAAGSHGVIVNLSVWRDPEALTAYVFGETHLSVLRRRREWFSLMREAYVACWWVPTGHRPTIEESEDRVRHLREHGPTAYAFTLKAPFAEPSDQLASADGPGTSEDV